MPGSNLAEDYLALFNVCEKKGRQKITPALMPQSVWMAYERVFAPLDCTTLSLTSIYP
jgi:hypothetical protein